MLFLAEIDLLRIFLVKLYKTNGFKTGYTSPDWGRQSIETVLPDMFDWHYLTIHMKNMDGSEIAFARREWQVVMARAGYDLYNIGDADDA